MSEDDSCECCSGSIDLPPITEEQAAYVAEMIKKVILLDPQSGIGTAPDDYYVAEE